MIVQEIYDAINAIAPFDTALDWDNSGVLIGSGGDNVTRIGVALDVTKQTVEQAVNHKVDLIITHHPVIFTPLTSVPGNTAVYDLIRHGIAVISAHTNLDAADGGVNDCLANVIELKNIRRGVNPLVRLGELSKSMSGQDFARHVKQRLECVVLYTAGSTPVRTVAVCGGAGFDECFFETKNGDVDAIITGDVKHHEFICAADNNITLVDGSHFYTEKLVIPVLTKHLQSRFGESNVIQINQTPPFDVL